MNLDSKNTIIFLSAVLIILIGFSYFLFLNNQAGKLTVDQQTTQLNTVSSYDDTDSIEKELKNTDFTNIDKEMNDIESQLE